MSRPAAPKANGAGRLAWPLPGNVTRLLGFGGAAGLMGEGHLDLPENRGLPPP